MTAFLFHEMFLRHDSGPFHPENPDRLQAIIRGVKQNGLWERLQHVSPVPATEEQILLAHTKRHFDFIAESARSGSFQIDLDTHVSSDSFDAAMLAAGAGIRAVDGIVTGEFTNAFAAVRPPGHHASADRAMGFCLFNNIAIAARYAVQKHGFQKVLIMDWDVHHGNGTQDIFYEDPTVIYVSLHKKYHYPGTGWEYETGGGKAAGTKINVPVDFSDPQMYEARFEETLDEAEAFRPQFIFISCGFDAHERDPLGNLGLKNATYAKMTKRLMEFASQFGHQRIFSILEGGYDYSALAEAGAAHIAQLMGEGL